MTPPVYTAMLQAITNSLLRCRQNNGTKLLYVLTTPVPTDGGNASSFPSHCSNADVVAYNKIARQVSAAILSFVFAFCFCVFRVVPFHL